MMAEREVHWGKFSRALRLLQPSRVLASGLSCSPIGHSASTSDPPNSNSARQPIELPAEFNHWHQLLRDSLWRFDPRSAVHLIRGAADRRLRPLLMGFWLTFIFGLGGTTPLPRWLLGRAFDILNIRTLYLLGHAHGNADRGYPRA